LNHGGHESSRGTTLRSPVQAVTGITGFCDDPIPVFVRRLRMIIAEMRTTSEILLK